jgi:hypothetical protein
MTLKIIALFQHNHKFNAPFFTVMLSLAMLNGTIFIVPLSVIMLNAVMKSVKALFCISKLF